MNIRYKMSYSCWDEDHWKYVVWKAMIHQGIHELKNLGSSLLWWRSCLEYHVYTKYKEIRKEYEGFDFPNMKINSFMGVVSNVLGEVILFLIYGKFFYYWCWVEIEFTLVNAFLLFFFKNLYFGSETKLK